MPPTPELIGHVSLNSIILRATEHETNEMGVKISLIHKYVICFLKNNWKPHAEPIKKIIMEETPNKLRSMSDV